MKQSDLTPGTITTLGALRPGDVGEYAGSDERFIVVKNDSPPWVRIEYADGQRSVKTSSLIVRYLGRGHIEPARIVMDGEPNRIAELEAQVRMLREFARECATNFDCDRDAHRYQTFCRQCEARAALAATAPKEERR